MSKELFLEARECAVEDIADIEGVPLEVATRYFDDYYERDNSYLDDYYNNISINHKSLQGEK